MKFKSKYNKAKCKNCIYHTQGSGMGTALVLCNYAAVTGHTCLKRGDKGQTIDIRGEDRDHCLLYQSGKAKRGSDKWLC